MRRGMGRGSRALMEIIRGRQRETAVAASIEDLETIETTFLFSGVDLIISGEAIAGGRIERDTMGGDRQDTTDTGEAIIAACALTEDGMFHDCDFVNVASADEDVTILAGSGVTVVNPTRIVGQERCAMLRFIRAGESSVELTIRGV